MGSTEAGAPLPELPPGLHLRVLQIADVDAAMALSAAAHWNQNADDWRLMLELGQGWGVWTETGAGPSELVASTVLLPQGPRIAWISMVLVRSDHQRRGLAARLLRLALDTLDGSGRAALLDATAAGREVYRRFDFVDCWDFTRHRREGAVAPAGPQRPIADGLRPLREDDWPQLAALDGAAFGADRPALLQALAQRLPQVAWVVEQGGRLRGFVLGRDGRAASQIGPLVADDPSTAAQLFAQALAQLDGPVLADLPQSQAHLLPALVAAGFVPQRDFSRMVRGAAGAPGRPQQMVLVAGPELG